MVSFPSCLYLKIIQFTILIRGLLMYKLLQDVLFTSESPSFCTFLPLSSYPPFLPSSLQGSGLFKSFTTKFNFI